MVLYQSSGNSKELRFSTNKTFIILRKQKFKDDDAVWCNGDEKGVGYNTGISQLQQPQQQAGYIAK